MRLLMAAFLVTCVAACQVPQASAQQLPGHLGENRERARAHYMAGWEHMQSEAYEKAAAEFQLATDFDEKFALAWYGLGRANLTLRRYRQAVLNLTTCRDLFSANASKKFNNQMDANRQRQDRLLELQDLRNQYTKGPQSNQTNDMVRLIDNSIRNTTIAFDRNQNVEFDNPIPPFVSLSLGSALFRVEQFDKAERAYRDALKADDSLGAAHNNLAVIYLMKKRFDDAFAELRAAEKAGFTVDPELKDAVLTKRTM
jgi:tetratricopeptide (TPR) repeat protein